MSTSGASAAAAITGPRPPQRRGQPVGLPTLAQLFAELLEAQVNEERARADELEARVAALEAVAGRSRPAHHVEGG